MTAAPALLHLPLPGILFFLPFLLVLGFEALRGLRRPRPIDLPPIPEGRKPSRVLGLLPVVRKRPRSERLRAERGHALRDERPIAKIRPPFL